jgi:enoyl-CoA hydratase/carnithine racemase
MDYREMLYEVDNRIATITRNRPETLNAFTSVMLDVVDIGGFRVLRV